MTRVALYGAGGKMGSRITNNLKDTKYSMYYVEVSEAGLKNLKEKELPVTAGDVAAKKADVVILAVPDRVIKEVSSEVVPQMKSGALLILLDPATAYMGEVKSRDDISLFVTHPCHPPIFNDEVTDEAKKDHFGGVHSKQPIVCAINHGGDKEYNLGEEIAKTMYKPVMRAHRISVEQMAIMEPTMAETITCVCARTMKEAMEEAVKRGVPYEAAKDFIFGHIQIALSIEFGLAENPFSDAALVAMDYGKEYLIKEGWEELFETKNLKENIYYMLNPEKYYQNQVGQE